MKKIWKDGTALGTMKIAIIASIVLIGVSISALFYGMETAENDDPCDEFSIKWVSSCEGDCIIIEIIEVHPHMELERILWTMLDDKGQTVTWEDPSGEAITMEGWLSDINFSQSEYSVAKFKESNTYYSRESLNETNKNHTLCVVFRDVNANGRFSNGDIVRIRTEGEGGASKEGFTFHLGVPPCSWGEKILITV